MTTHEPESWDRKVTLSFQEPGASSVLIRIPCSCGWRGSWFADSDYAQRSFDRHVEQATAKPEAVSA